MPEEKDLEDYLEHIRERMKNQDIWDDIWMIEERDNDNNILDPDIIQ